MIGKIKKGIALLVFVTVLIGVIAAVPFSANAAAGEFDITVSDAVAVPGDTVVFNVDISDNPGIMAITITFHYDPQVLKYEKYIPGIIPMDTLADHDSYVSIVWCGNKNKTKNGTLFSMQFTVKENAPAGNYDVSIKNIRPQKYGNSLSGCFANWERSVLRPNAQSGTLTVKHVGDNCDHRFSEWNTTAEPGCTESGAQTRSCEICGHTESRSVDPIGHGYAVDYTVDRAATQAVVGIMSRHCVRCNALTDKVYFTPSEAKAVGFENTVGVIVNFGKWQQYEAGSSENTSSQTSGNPSAPEKKDSQGGVTDNIEKNTTQTADALIEQYHTKNNTSSKNPPPKDPPAKNNESKTDKPAKKEVTSKPTKVTDGTSGKTSSDDRPDVESNKNREEQPDDEKPIESGEKTGQKDQKDQKDQPADRQITVTETVGFWEFLFGRGESVGLWRALINAIPKHFNYWWLLLFGL